MTDKTQIGYYKAPDGYVFTGREHSGDENGNSRWEVGRVYVSDGKTKNQLQCMAILTVAVTMKSMAKMAMDFGQNGAYMMTGRYHKGDETKNSWYTSAKAKVDLY